MRADDNATLVAQPYGMDYCSTRLTVNRWSWLIVTRELRRHNHSSLVPDTSLFRSMWCM